MSDYWWGNPQQFSARMWAEVAAMKAAFDVELKKGKKITTQARWDEPFILFTHKLKLNISQDPRKPFWTVEFSMKETVENSDARSNDHYRLKIQYLSDYPSREPQVTVPSHSLGTNLANHVFEGGILCLHDHSSTRTGWDPGSSTAATFGLWSVEWIRAWRYAKRNNNNWPSDG